MGLYLSRSSISVDLRGAATRHPSRMCGIVGVWNHPEAAKLTYLGLHALQHRGQESAGIVSVTEDGRRFARHQGMGLVADIFTADKLARLEGNASIGHVRYSTAGGPSELAVQPFTIETVRGSMSLAHNGNLVNADELRLDLEREGAIFSSHSDTEVLMHLVARSRAKRFVDRLREALAPVEGAYSLLVMTPDAVIGLRDPEGFRPLVLGKHGQGWVLASETCALELIEAEFVREVEPGEIVTIDKDGVRSERLVHAPNSPRRSCIFELIYFARPNSTIFGRSVYEARYEMGKQLARDSPADADLVIPVPDSGVPAALGYSEASGLPFRHGLLRSHYVGRTFIEPKQEIRHFGVKLKLSAVRSVLGGKRVVVVDDSIVRGTTSRKIVKILRDAGAAEVHFRISSPPTTHPCFYGIDTPTREELIASRHTVPEIREFLTADSLAYLTPEGLHRAVIDRLGPERTFCNACFTGDYSSGRELIQSRLKIVTA
jgi:amidophosphoribosyltransferase